MSLFNFGKKKEDKKTTACCSCGAEEVKEPTTCCGGETKAESICCGEPVEGICGIKVLGAGCSTCHKQYEYVKEAVANMGLAVEVEYITDMERVMAYGVMSMPAIVVNETVVCSGKLLKASETQKLLKGIR